MVGGWDNNVDANADDDADDCAADAFDDQSKGLDAFDDDDPARIVAALELDIYSPIQVTQTLPGGSVTSNLVIQGTVHTITPQSWFTEFLVGQSYVSGFFVLDSSISGVLDSDVLGY